MKTMPASSSFAKSSFSAESFVHAVAPSPNELSFRDVDCLRDIVRSEATSNGSENLFAIRW